MDFYEEKNSILVPRDPNRLLDLFQSVHPEYLKGANFYRMFIPDFNLAWKEIIEVCKVFATRSDNYCEDRNAIQEKAYLDKIIGAIGESYTYFLFRDKVPKFPLSCLPDFNIYPMGLKNWDADFRTKDLYGLDKNIHVKTTGRELRHPTLGIDDISITFNGYNSNRKPGGHDAVFENGDDDAVVFCYIPKKNSPYSVGVIQAVASFRSISRHLVPPNNGNPGKFCCWVADIRREDGDGLVRGFRKSESGLLVAI